MENNNNINLNQDIIRQLNQVMVNPLNEITTSPLNQETVNSTNNQPVNPLNQPINPTNQEKINSLNQALNSLKQELSDQLNLKTNSDTEKNNNLNSQQKNEEKNKKKKKRNKNKNNNNNKEEEEKKSLFYKFLEDIKYLKNELENLRRNYFTIKLTNYNGLKKRSEKLDEKIKKINILDENNNNFSEKLNELKNQIEDMFNFVLKEHKSQDNFKKEGEKISEAINVNETIKQFKNPQTTISEINLTNNNLYEQLKELRSRIDCMFDFAFKTIKSQKDVNEACEKAFESTCNNDSVESWQFLQFIISETKNSMQEAKNIINKNMAVLTKVCACFKEYVECLEEIIK